MQTLNFIYPERSSIRFERFVFPDGQPHLRLDLATVNQDESSCRVICRIANPSDLLIVLFAKNALEELGIAEVELEIAYLMAARMDRLMNEGEAFSLRVVATMLNTANFKKVTIFDPHSDVSTALIQRSKAITNIEFVRKVLNDAVSRFPTMLTKGYCLVSPDAGALKKIYQVAKALGAEQVVECIKHRDVRTGKLSGFKVLEDDLQEKTCFIVDDLCDGGATFIGLAKELKARNAGDILLVVSHGIFSKGFHLEGIQHSYTTNSFQDFTAEVEGLTVLEYQN